jgi:small GTP-binding protein
MRKRKSKQTISGLKLEFTLRGHKDHVHGIAWSPDGKMLVSAAYDHTIRMWDAESGKLIRTFKGHSEEVFGITWSPDGTLIASASKDKTIKIWDVKTGRGLKELKELDYVFSVAWSPDGGKLASGGKDSNVMIWDTKTWELRNWLVGHSSPISAVAWSPNGRFLATSSSDESIRFWDSETGQQRQILEGHTGWVLGISWSPDGQVIASASVDHTVRIWDTTSARQLAVLEGHTQDVTGVSFSADGLLLASTSLGGTTRLWLCDTWEVVREFDEPSPCSLSRVAFHPQEYVLASAGDKNTVHIWSINPDRLTKDADDIPSFHYKNAKVVLVGDTGVGKSALGLVLTGQSFTPTESTHGRRVRTLNSITVQTSFGRQETREVLLWDLAGQPDYRLIHQLHLNEVVVALLVFDSRSHTDPFAGVQYWDRALRQSQSIQGSATLPLKKILVEARADRGGVSISAPRLESFVKESGFSKYIRTSAREGWGVAELLEAIHDAIDWKTLPKVSSTDLFQTIKSFLIAEKEAGRLLSTTDDLYRAFQKYKSYLPEANNLRAQFETCIGRVEASGLIRRLSFGGLILLQPELVDGYASAIINAAKDEPDGFGYINEEDAMAGRFRMSTDERIKDRNQESLLLLSTIEDLLKYELALREEGYDATYLVFPSQLTRENPELPDPEGKAVIFTFEGPVQNIYSTLVVRLSRSGIFEKKDMWKNAILYSVKDGSSYGMFLREVQEGSGELTLFFSRDANEENRTLFEDYIYRHLQRRALPSSIKRRRIFVCPQCSTPLPDLAVTRRLERGFRTTFCPVCEAEISIYDSYDSLPVSIPLISNDIDQSAENSRRQETATSILHGKVATKDYDVLLLHNSFDKAAVKDIAEMLKKEGILPWLDEWELAPGQPWQVAIEENLNQIKSVMVFVGRKGTGPWQDIEKLALLRHFLAQNRRVIPVILPSARETRDVPVFLKTLSWVDLRRPNINHIEQLISAITGNPYLGSSAISSTLRKETVQAESPDSLQTQEDELNQKLVEALNREDWATAYQHLVELSRLAMDNSRGSLAEHLALNALRIADDPLKLDGKGLHEPLEFLSKVEPRIIEDWIPHCFHRREVLNELRLIAGGGNNEVTKIIKKSGISQWRDWFNTSSPDILAISSLPRGGQGWPAIRLSRLRLENIKSFKNFSLDFRLETVVSHMCTTIVGDNAIGKTTLLQSIALGCIGLTLANQESLGARSLLKEGEDSGAIELEFEFSIDPEATEDEKTFIAIGLELDIKNCRPLPHSKMVFGDVNHMEHWTALRNQINFDWGFCCGYGAFRGLRERKEGLLSVSTTSPEIDRIFSVFQPQSTLIDPTILQAMLRSDVSSIARERQNIPLGIRDEILKMFAEIIPGMKIQEQNGQQELIEKWGGVKEFSVLSDGYNSMIGLLGHLVKHALEFTGWLKGTTDTPIPRLISPLSIAGIVLIDEVDLHLHPTWQRYILSQLQSAFPNIQFIVTTHSPLVLGATPEVQVIVLKRGDNDQAIALTDLPSIRGWRVDQLLTGAPFDVSSPYDLVTERLTIKYAKLLNEVGPDHKDVIALEKELSSLNTISFGSTKLDRDAWKLLNEFADYRLKNMTIADREQTVAKLWEMLNA